MPTFNTFTPQLKITRSFGSNLSKYQNENNKGKKRFNCSQKVGSLTREASAPVFPTVSDSLLQNLSDSSLQCMSGEYYNSEESCTEDFRFISRASKWMNDPALVPGNRRKSRTKSASRVLEELLDGSSLELDRGVEDDEIEPFQCTQIKPIKKNYTQRQKKSRQSLQDIYRDVQFVNAAKSVNLFNKLIRNSKPDSKCPELKGQDSEDKKLPLRGKTNIDMGVNSNPHALKPSVPNSYHVLPRSNFSAGSTRHFIKNADNLQWVNPRQTSQENDSSKFKKVDFTKKESSSLLDGSDSVAPCARTGTSKSDHLSNSEKAQPLQGTKKTPKVEIKTKRRENTLQQQIINEKQRAKEMRIELKRKQRKEIYALNKVMTELENERFIKFMQNSASHMPGV